MNCQTIVDVSINSLALTYVLNSRQKQLILEKKSVLSLQNFNSDSSKDNSSLGSNVHCPHMF